MPAKSNSKPATHAELKKEIDRVDGKIRRLTTIVLEDRAKIEKIQGNMATKADVERILNAVDSFAKKAEAYDQKALTHGAILQDHEAKLREHDRRLATIETKG